MPAESINYIISIALLLYATLIAYGVIPIKVKPEKVEKWEKAKMLLKISGPVGMAIFAVLLLISILK